MIARGVTCLAFVLPLLVWCAATGSDAVMKTGQHAHEFAAEVTVRVKGKYLLYLPADYGRTEKRWPLILFLHGAGERGSNIDLVKRHGPPKILAEGGDFPPECPAGRFIVASPQCPRRGWWPAQNEFLVALLDHLLGKYAIDPDRVYLTGLSMGGYGTWSLATEHPDRFAAIAIICGGGDPARAARLKGIPAWVFHGARDKTVPLKQSQAMVDALRRCGGNVKLTVYPKAGHDSWTKTYNNPELYKWLLKHRRSKATSRRKGQS